MSLVEKYLLDTSALYPLVKRLREKILDHTGILVFLDLTVYEVGNVIWKEHRRGRVRDPVKVASLFQEIFSVTPMIKPDIRVNEVLKLAIQENLTFYDAAYLYTARKHRLKLVTEDRDLQRFPESISVEQLLKELTSSQQ